MPSHGPRSDSSRKEEPASGWLKYATAAIEGARGAARRISAASVDTDFEERMRILKQHYREKGPDPFGLDVESLRAVGRFVALLHRNYFRSVVFGVDNVPLGRGMLVANHSGQLPIDGVMLCAALLLEASPPRLVRAMVDKWMQTLPFIAPLIARWGQVVGVPDNCRRLLEREELILVFPEGVPGIVKPYTRRYQLEQFGTGFMRLALATKSPIVPVAVVGAEEQYVSVGNLEWLARALGLPAFPLVPQLLLPGGLLPLPTRYRIHFGEPLQFDSDPEDDEAVRRNVWLVKQTVQRLLQRGVQERSSVFF